VQLIQTRAKNEIDKQTKRQATTADRKLGLSKKRRNHEPRGDFFARFSGGSGSILLKSENGGYSLSSLLRARFLVFKARDSGSCVWEIAAMAVQHK
jgi:hypothetical protein